MNLSLLPFPVLILVVVAALALMALFWLQRDSSGFLPKPVRRTVSILRILGLAALLLAILNPFWKREKPDPSAYQIAVLVDASRSMESRDLPGGESRLEWVSNWLGMADESTSWMALADPETPVMVRLFGSDSIPWDGRTVTKPEPGQTAIGTALSQLSADGQAPGGKRLGGVLLLSDGINLSGERPSIAAQSLARAGVPVSVIGIGRSTIRGDVAIAFSRESQTYQEGESGETTVVVTNSFEDSREGTLALYQNEQLLESRSVVTAAGETRGESFSIRPEAAGVDTLRAVFSPDFDGANPSTNVSFSIAEIERRNHSRILLMAARAGWQERLLRILAQENESIRMDSLIRIDETRFIKNIHPEPDAGEAGGSSAVDRETITSVPGEAAFYRDYDAIILDLAMALEFGQELSTILESFAGKRGGGILLVHPGKQDPAVIRLPESIRSLFPARSYSSVLVNEPVQMEFAVNPLFTDQIGGVLFSTPRPQLPDRTWISVPGELSRAAQVAARVGQEDYPFLVTQIYGAGRTAWLASDALWHWRFDDEISSNRFNAFWEGLLGWLSVGGKSRIEAPINASVVSMDEPADLGIQVLGPDYSPRMDAIVRAVITSPDGRIGEERLLPSVDQPGRYERSSILEQSGTYKIDYRVVFPDGDELEQSAWFAVAANSPETRDTAFQEKSLRDIARISGGQYRSYENWNDLAPLPVSPAVPLVEKRIYWTRTWPFLLVALILFLVEWWLRRRHGLR